VSPAHVIHLIEHSQVAYRIEHSAAVQAIVGTLLTTLVGLAVAAFFNRRRIARRPYVDAPIALDADLAKTIGGRVIHKVYVADSGLGQGGQPTENGSGPGTPIATAEVQIPWLVLLRIRNSGRVTISGADTPLTFSFPGREVRDVAVIDGAGDDPDRILVRPKKADPGPRTPATSPGRFRRLAGWARGRPAATDSDPILRQGKLVGGKIIPEPPRGGPGMRSVVEVTAPSGTVQSVALNGLSGSF
jgi:hypothetical protein